MELKEMFSEDFQRAMKRVARGTQRGSVTEHPVAASTSKKEVVGKGKYAGNFSFHQPKKDKVENEETVS